MFCKAVSRGSTHLTPAPPQKRNPFGCLFCFCGGASRLTRPCSLAVPKIRFAFPTRRSTSSLVRRRARKYWRKASISLMYRRGFGVARKEYKLHRSVKNLSIYSSECRYIALSEQNFWYFSSLYSLSKNSLISAKRPSPRQKMKEKNDYKTR